MEHRVRRVVLLTLFSQHCQVLLAYSLTKPPVAVLSNQKGMTDGGTSNIADRGLAELFHPLLKSVWAEQIALQTDKAPSGAAWLDTEPACYWRLDPAIRHLTKESKNLGQRIDMTVTSVFVVHPGTEYMFVAPIQDTALWISNTLVCGNRVLSDDVTDILDQRVMSKEYERQNSPWTFQISRTSELLLCTTTCYKVSWPRMTMSALLKFDHGAKAEKGAWEVSVAVRWHGALSEPQTMKRLFGLFGTQQTRTNIHKTVWDASSAKVPETPGSMLLEFRSAVSEPLTTSTKTSKSATALTTTVCCNICGSSLAVFHEVRNALILLHDRAVELTHRPRPTSRGVVARTWGVLAKALGDRCKPVNLEEKLQKELREVQRKTNMMWSLTDPSVITKVLDWQKAHPYHRTAQLVQVVFRDAPEHQAEVFISVGPHLIRPSRTMLQGGPFTLVSKATWTSSRKVKLPPLIKKNRLITLHEPLSYIEKVCPSNSDQYVRCVLTYQEEFKFELQANLPKIERAKYV